VWTPPLADLGYTLVLTLVEATSGRRGVIDEETGEVGSALRAQRSWPSWISMGPRSGEALPAAHLVDAVARRVADVERLDCTLMGRRRKGRRRWGGKARGRWKRQRIAAVPHRLPLLVPRPLPSQTRRRWRG